MRKKIIIANALLLIVIGISFVQSCSSSTDENLEILQVQNKEKELLNQEVSYFKSEVIDALQQSKTRNSDTLLFSKQQIRELRETSLEFLISQGFEEQDYRDFMKEDDPRLIFMAALYTGILETNVDRIFGMKTRNEGGSSGGPISGDDSTCYSVAQVTICLQRAVLNGIGADDIMKAIAGKCATKKLCKTLVKVFVKKVPIVGIVSALDAFADCMGWYSWD